MECWGYRNTCPNFRAVKPLLGYLKQQTFAICACVGRCNLRMKMGMESYSIKSKSDLLLFAYCDIVTLPPRRYNMTNTAPTGVNIILLFIHNTKLYWTSGVSRFDKNSTTWAEKENKINLDWHWIRTKAVRWWIMSFMLLLNSIFESDIMREAIKMVDPDLQALLCQQLLIEMKETCWV